MKIWQLTDPSDYRFAQAGRRGTWSESEGLCPECTASGQERVRPLVIEWEPGATLVGDFVWPGFGSDIAVTERVRNALSGRFRGFEFGPVEMIQDPKLRRGRRSKPRVWLPYEGPPLHDLQVTCWVGADRDRSTITLTKACSTCGREYYAISGVEKWETRWDRRRGEMLWIHTARKGGEGLFVCREALAGADIFRVRELPGAILCSDRVKLFIEEQAFTNCGFLELGDIA